MEACPAHEPATMSITEESQRVGRSASRAVWPAVFFGALWILGWGPPLWRGHGHFKPFQVYLGFFAGLACLASVAVASAPVRWRRPLAFRLIAVLGMLLLAVPLGDLAYTLWSVRLGHLWYYSLSFSRAHNVTDPDLVWRRKPGLSWRGRKTPDCELVSYRADENGFRNPPGIKRAEIVVVGDSVTEAGEVEEDATFVHKLAGELGVTAVNLGTSGYGPQQELEVLRRFGLSYGPRLIVWQFTEWNDLQDAQMYVNRHSPEARTLPPWKELYATHSPIMQLAASLRPGRRPSLVGFERSDGVLEERAFWPYHSDLHEQLPAGFAETQRVIASAFELCRSRGIAFVVLYVPSHVRVLLPYLRFRADSEREKFCPGGVADREADLAHAMSSHCERLGCPMVDMTPFLRRRAAQDNRGIYVPNDPHLGVDGHDEVHKALARFAESRLGPPALMSDRRP